MWCAPEGPATSGGAWGAGPGAGSGCLVERVVVGWVQWGGALSGCDAPSLLIGVGPEVGRVGFAVVGPAGEGFHQVMASAQAGEVDGVGMTWRAVGVRSEERRVGKGCVSTWRYGW